MSSNKEDLKTRLIPILEILEYNVQNISGMLSLARMILQAPENVKISDKEIQDILSKVEKVTPESFVDAIGVPLPLSGLKPLQVGKPVILE